ncbi:MAG TPA: family 6 glucosyltransferase [Defluviitoga tunisiensis]|nr:family 6 glucosyltransferase [Defluviitoga tunisiensis]
MKSSLAILYIATGKYIIFWKDFFESSEKYLLNAEGFEKHYFIFTDALQIEHENNPRVHKIYQEPLPWPYITLDRFTIFQKARKELEKMDFIYFFNANMLIVKPIGKEILPNRDKPIVMVQHPGFFNKKRKEYTYETNPRSRAYVPDNIGKYYFMGGLNGGLAKDYLEMVDELRKRVEEDKKNGIIAVWHDESHLNRYAVDYPDKIKILDPSYGYPEGWNLPFDPKIIIRDKNKYGGHNYLRGITTSRTSKLKEVILRLFK